VITRGVERRLAVLAALFAASRAAALLARAGRAGAAGAVAQATHLAALPRRERLHALADAMAVDAQAAGARAEAAALLERAGVAEILRGLATGSAPPGASTALVRLCRERIGR